MDDNPIAQLRAIYRGLLELQRLLVHAPGGPVFHVKFSAYEQYQDLVERANKIVSVQFPWRSGSHNAAYSVNPHRNRLPRVSCLYGHSPAARGQGSYGDRI